ncbi:hypothetical protein BDV32DRAFT_148546 [Aspergillus pseudonomiae]|uniref:Uncharacterized protein n=1 Tax=Aspergillus pseudonomiae TaxID=1506151 RepID=A0A5N7DVD3_9EURO|nr:uncharacterized protein BDV37DRAFT_277657 [Aspergillus pseudonomiae]KAB8261279.1 hypothetical protein BDV32DRAFT_148546 [Aspergillus pseudonomiae]KAE8410013.1 hypothetical protein BDV37DRAFT_277657 [Aspergillus pseudonomiae]
MSDSVDLATDAHAVVEKKTVTVILDTNDEAFLFDSSLAFKTESLLIYAEKIKISGQINLPGKNVGIFCSKLTVDGPATINVSGDDGRAGDTSINEEGGEGGDGQNAGNVWVFVQDLTVSQLQELKIESYGGTGGMGGDTSASGKIGGNGGKGGDAGNIEFLYGSKYQAAYLAFRELYSQPWPEKARNLLQGSSCRELPSYVSAEDKAIVANYVDLANALLALDRVLDNVHGQSSIAHSIQQMIHSNLSSKPAPLKTPDSQIIRKIQRAKDQIRQSVRIQQSNIDSFWKDLETTMHGLTPEDDSKLIDVMVTVLGDIKRDLTGIETKVREICKTGNGVGGRGGSSGTAGSKPGSKGEDSKQRGTVTPRNLRLDGHEEDLVASQVFAFPDQCQMLVNNANKLFFANTEKDRKRASKIYDTIITRLRFLDALKGEKIATSGLGKAYTTIETNWAVTLSGLTQLRSVYEESLSRFNRLLVGEDMFGHRANWAPRLAFQYYKESVNDQLSFLKQQEDYTAGFEKAVKKEEEQTRYIEKSRNAMTSNKQAADSEIQLLTDTNGPLRTTAYKIVAFTPLLKKRRQEIKNKISQIELSTKLDPELIIEGIGMLITVDPSRSAIKDFLDFGYKLYNSTTMVKDAEGNDVKKEYIIEQLGDAGDSLESLVEALQTNKNDKTIQLDDPGAMKLIASNEGIKKILKNFKDAIPESQKRKLEADLDDYLKTVLTRNNAVLEYNSNVLLLKEALQSRQYAQEQIENLGQAALKIDPSLPAVVFWLRKMRDSLRLVVMKYLNYESRAIRFWGLRKEVPFAAPGPLMNYIALQNNQMHLQSMFDDSVALYSGNIRVVWPRNSADAGLRYKLTQEQLKILKTPDNEGRYTVFIPLNFHNSQGIFGDSIDVRLQEVRVWVFGAEIAKIDENGHRKLTIQVTHLGNETIYDEERAPFDFEHDSTEVQFAYHVDLVPSIREANWEAIFSAGGLEHDFVLGGQPVKSSRAPLGPFTTWRLQIREKDANPGIKMQGVHEVWLEFRGSNRSSKYSNNPRA